MSCSTTVSGSGSFVSDRMLRGVISLLKKNKVVSRELDDYRHMVLLNAELNILAINLTELFQSVAEILLGSGQYCAVKIQTIQSNLHQIRTILVRVQITMQKPR